MLLSRARSALLAGVASAALVAISPAASAQSGGLDFSTWQVGGMVVVAPKYEGSESYRVLGFPLVMPGGFESSGRVAVKSIDDVRFRLFDLGGFEVGPVAGYRFGRDEDDGNLLTGLGDVDGGLVVGAYAGYRFGPLLASLSYGHQVTGEDDAGGLLRFGVESKFKPADRITMTAGVGTTWADDDYMSTYFGVTPAQATGARPAFDADAGIKDVNLSLSSDVALDQSWTLKLMGRYSHLVGDAADSPIVETENQFFGGVGLTYRFGPRPSPNWK